MFVDTTRRVPRHALFVGIFLLIVSTVAMAVVWRSNILSPLNAALAAVTIWVGLIPGMVFLLTDGPSRRPHPLMALTGLFYAVFYGASVFYSHHMYLESTGRIYFYLNTFTETTGAASIKTINEEAQFLVLLGMAALLATWTAIRSFKIKGDLTFKFRGFYQPSAIAILCVALVLGNISYLMIPSVSAVPSVGQFLLPGGFLGFGVLFAMAVRKDFGVWCRLAVYFGLVPGWFAVSVSQGFLTSAVMASIYLILIYRFVIGRFPWKTLIVAIVIFMTVYPLMNRYRAYIWYWDYRKSFGIVEEQRTGFLNRLKILGDVAAQMYFTKKPDDFYTNRHSRSIYLTQGLIQRTSGMLVLSHVYDRTPHEIPYWGGATYKPLLSSFIPRAIWPDKPQERIGQRFAHRYGMVEEVDNNMSVNLPWITELFINFGIAGVGIGMMLIGLLIGILERLLTPTKGRPTEYVVGLGILLPLFFQDSNFSVMTGSLHIFTAMIWIYFSFGTYTVQYALSRFRLKSGAVGKDRSQG